MNYLAHLYLSGESDEIKLGNFIGDFVKGNKYQHYPEMVAYGIQLHRKIDSFTATHQPNQKGMPTPGLRNKLQAEADRALTGAEHVTVSRS